MSVCVRELDDDDDDDAITPSFLHLLYIYTYTHKHTHISHFVHISRECGVRAKGGSDGTNASEKKNTKNKNVIPTGWKRCLVIWRCWYTPIAHNAHKIVCVAPGAIMFPPGG